MVICYQVKWNENKTERFFQICDSAGLFLCPFLSKGEREAFFRPNGLFPLEKEREGTGFFHRERNGEKLGFFHWKRNGKEPGFFHWEGNGEEPGFFHREREREAFSGKKGWNRNRVLDFVRSRWERRCFCGNRDARQRNFSGGA